MKIQVTQDDIDHGRSGDCNFCPVARAVKRATHLDLGVRVTIGYVYLGNLVNFQLLSKVADFVYDFDVGMPVKPFEFELDPENWVRVNT